MAKEISKSPMNSWDAPRQWTSRSFADVISVNYSWVGKSHQYVRRDTKVFKRPAFIGSHLKATSTESSETLNLLKSRTASFSFDRETRWLKGTDAKQLACCVSSVSQSSPSTNSIYNKQHPRRWIPSIEILRVFLIKRKFNFNSNV